LLRDSGKVVKLGVSKANGIYSFAGMKDGNYKVSASFVGYKNGVSSPFTFSNADVQVPELKLSKGAAQLNTVAVTSQKPVIEVKADKMIVNVEGTINSVDSDALDLLRKSPGVQVDKDDNLSMSGKTGVQVYVDGRPTPLAGQYLANYLKSLQSSNIEAIELITNPSAKYDAAGNAGIINIRLKKNKSFGTNGSVNVGWNQGITPKYNAGLSINYRNIEGMKNYVAIYCDKQKILVYTSMKELEGKLPQKQFMRVHKYFIIPVNKITGIEGNLLRLKNISAEIIIGESYKAELMEMVKNKTIQ